MYSYSGWNAATYIVGELRDPTRNLPRALFVGTAIVIALYVGLELMSLPLYVVAASHRNSLRSTEAGLKYFVLGALSSGMLLYGASLVYGFTGTVSFVGIAHSAADAGSGLIFGLVFLFVGFCFKVSAVPFHMWTPDVYEGAPTPVTAFFAAAPKVAGIAMFVRATVVAFPGITAQWQEIVVFVSIASMLLGAFAALALLLAVVGLYGVMSYLVTQRTREFGIRVALGAQQASVLVLILKQGLKLSLIGVGLGVAAAMGLTHVMPTFIAVATILTVVALAACWIPAWRATKVDPMVALRYE